MKWKMKDLLRYRNVWLGFAMIWIMLYHSGLDLPGSLLTYLKRIGYGGVDICLFASGIGCYYSLEKDPDGLHFLKRRLIRLAPAYLCFMICWCLFCVVKNEISGQEVLGNLLGIQYLTGRGLSFNWYISGLIVYYLLAPYFKALTDRLDKLWMQAAVLAVMLLITAVYWKADDFIILVTRLPIYYAGMVFARQCQCRQEKQLGVKEMALFMLVMLAGIGLLWPVFHLPTETRWSFGLCWYPFLLITPGLCVLISAAAMMLEATRLGRWLLKFPELVGRNSFEVYLIHIPLYEVCLYEGYLEKVSVGRLTAIPENVLWLCTVPVVAAGCFLLKAAEKTVTNIARRHEKSSIQ